MQVYQRHVYNSQWNYWWRNVSRGTGWAQLSNARLVSLHKTKYLAPRPYVQRSTGWRGVTWPILTLLWLHQCGIQVQAEGHCQEVLVQENLMARSHVAPQHHHLCTPTSSILPTPLPGPSLKTFARTPMVVSLSHINLFFLIQHEMAEFNKTTLN